MEVYLSEFFLFRSGGRVRGWVVSYSVEERRSSPVYIGFGCYICSQDVGVTRLGNVRGDRGDAWLTSHSSHPDLDGPGLFKASLPVPPHRHGQSGIHIQLNINRTFS